MARAGLSFLCQNRRHRIHCGNKRWCEFGGLTKRIDGTTPLAQRVKAGAEDEPQLCLIRKNSKHTLGFNTSLRPPSRVEKSANSTKFLFEVQPGQVAAILLRSDALSAGE